MGPRLSTGRSLREYARELSLATRFNGAPSLDGEEPGANVFARPFEDHRFNGAPSLDGEEPSLSSIADTRTSRFNGAPSLDGEERATLDAPLGAVGLASMGPRLSTGRSG